MSLLETSPGVPVVEQRPVVLCIDDDPPVLSAIRRLLGREPYELLTTLDPAEVMAMVSTREVKLIIADQRMPLMLGTELLKSVRSVSPDTVCVILTGHADLGDITGAMNDGAVDRLIRKPWDDEELRTLIRDLLGRSGPGGLEGGGDPPPFLAGRTILRLDCAGRTPADILAQIEGVLGRVGGPPRGLVFAFDQLMALSGSLTEFLSEVVKLLIRRGARTALVDGSGTAGTFLELVGGRLPVVVYRHEDELGPVKRILIVEDQNDTLEYLRALIESAGHTCTGVGSVKEAIGRLSDTPFDLVLLDLVLPDAEGIEVSRYILERRLSTSVVAISGFLDRASGESFLQAGMARQLSKPYRARDILDAIRDS
jgi:CheY-like chemotaxis protein